MGADTEYPLNLLCAIEGTSEEDFDKNVPADIIGTLDYLLDRLDEKSHDIILSRYKDKETYEQISKRHGVSRERIRQISQLAIRRLRCKRARRLLECGIAEYIAQERIAAAKNAVSEELADAVSKINIIAESLNLDIRFGRNAALSMPIGELDLSPRSFNSLARAGLKTVGDIVNVGPDLSKIRNFGSKCYDEVAAKLYTLGFSIEEKRSE